MGLYKVVQFGVLRLSHLLSTCPPHALPKSSLWDTTTTTQMLRLTVMYAVFREVCCVVLIEIVSSTTRNPSIRLTSVMSSWLVLQPFMFDPVFPSFSCNIQASSLGCQGISKPRSQEWQAPQPCQGQRTLVCVAFHALT